MRVLYLPGLDIVQHALFGATNAGAIAPSEAALRLQALEQYYEFLDALLAPLVGQTPMDGRLIVLVTEPGRVSQPLSGVLAISGAPAASTHPSGVNTAVAATILYALGVPVARDLASPAETTLFAPAFVAAHPLRDVSTYGSRRASQAPTGRALDREMIERMRTLGYIR